MWAPAQLKVLPIKVLSTPNLEHYKLNYTRESVSKNVQNLVKISSFFYFNRIIRKCFVARGVARGILQYHQNHLISL